MQASPVLSLLLQIHSLLIIPVLSILHFHLVFLSRKCQEFLKILNSLQNTAAKKDSVTGKSLAEFLKKINSELLNQIDSKSLQGKGVGKLILSSYKILGIIYFTSLQRKMAGGND